MVDRYSDVLMDREDYHVCGTLEEFEQADKLCVLFIRGEVTVPPLIDDGNPLSEVWGKWPGDETIEEILDALK